MCICICTLTHAHAHTRAHTRTHAHTHSLRLTFPLARTIIAVLAERNLFNRERASGLYSTWAYSLSKLMVELPAVCLWPTLFGLIAYWMVGLRSDAAKFGGTIDAEEGKEGEPVDGGQ